MQARSCNGKRLAQSMNHRIFRVVGPIKKKLVVILSVVQVSTANRRAGAHPIGERGAVHYLKLLNPLLFLSPAECMIVLNQTHFGIQARRSRSQPLVLAVGRSRFH